MTRLARFSVVAALAATALSCSSPESARLPTSPGDAGVDPQYGVLAPAQPCGCEVSGAGTYVDSNTGQSASFTIDVFGTRATTTGLVFDAGGTVTLNHPTFRRVKYRINFLRCRPDGGATMHLLTNQGSPRVTIEVAGNPTTTPDGNPDLIQFQDFQRGFTSGGPAPDGSIVTDITTPPACP